MLSAAWLLQFQHHATSLHVLDVRARRHPTTELGYDLSGVNAALAAPMIPPALFAKVRAAARTEVVVDVQSAELHAVSWRVRQHRIAGVSAVQARVSWYWPTSSVMENVEYSAEYQRPSVR